MPLKKIQITNIWAGMSPSQYFTADGQYRFSVGIDPYLPVSDSVGDRLATGVLRPSGYAAFSGVAIDDNPLFVITNPKNTNTYVALQNGALISYNSSLGSETDIGTITGSKCNGAVYYNNYIYLAGTTDISRYGPLDGSPSLTNGVWSGSTLGTQTNLVNTTYPSIRGGGTLPNHIMHVHSNGVLYVADFDSTSSDDTTRGKGLIHAIATKYGSAEGDTNNGSAYNVLDLPPGYKPTCIESYGNDLVIGAVQGADSDVGQGVAALFFWDTFTASYYNVVPLPDVLVTGLKNVNGILYVFTGSVSSGTDVANGYRVTAYLGGQTLKTIHYSTTGSPPLHGAIEAVGDRIYWGTFQQKSTTTPGSPSYYASVMSLGTHDPNLPGGVHGVINATATGATDDGLVTCLKRIQQESFSYPKFVVGHRDAGGYGLDKQSTTYGTAIWQSQLFNINTAFEIKRIRVSLGAAVAANMTITPTIYVDDFSSSSTEGLTPINNTNYSASERHIEWTPQISGNSNFVLELAWSGSALCPVLLPIEIDVELLDD